MAVSRRLHLADMRYSVKAKRIGMDGSLRALMEAREAGITPALALALRQQETGLRGDGNVFGHDPTIYAGAGKVTKSKYLAYKRKRGSHGQGGMQGVGPLQLTYYSFQDEADKMGGCWIPKYNYRVGYRLLASLIRKHGERKGLAVYNGGEVHPNYAYADSVLKYKAEWHRRLFG